MPTTDIESFIITLISSASASVFLAGVVMFLARSWIGERLKASIKHEYDQKLVALNAELNAQADTQTALLNATIEKELEKLRSATSSISAIQKVSIDKKLEAIDIVWGGILEMRKNIPPIMNFIEALSIEQYAKVLSDPRGNVLLGGLSIEGVKKIVEDKIGLLERSRPYVGEHIWTLFSTYQILVIGLLLFIDKGKEGHTKLNWHEDAAINKILSSSLTPEELNEFNSLKIGKFRWLQQTYERHMLLAMQKIISGQEVGEETLKQVQDMEKQVQAWRRDEDYKIFKSW